MNTQKSLIGYFVDAYDRYRAERRASASLGAPPHHPGRLGRTLRWFVPNGGTLLLAALLVLTANVWAKPLAGPVAAPGPSATTVNYQGRLADSGGTPLDGTYGMTFSLYDAPSGGSPVWGPESHTAVPVNDGLFSVGLGSQTGGGIPTSTWDGDRYLEITVGGETLSPRELIRSVPIAGMALTVPDGTIKSVHIEDNSVTADDLSSTAVGKWTMFTNDQQIVQHSGGGSFDWQVHDLSGVVPAAATIVNIKISMMVSGGNGYCSVRPYNSTSYGIEARTPAAGLWGVEGSLVAVNDAKFEYRCGLDSGATLTSLEIALWGYYEPGY